MQQAFEFLTRNMDYQYGSLNPYFVDKYAHEPEHWWLAFKDLLCAYGKACQEDTPPNGPPDVRIEQLREFLTKAMFLRWSIAQASVQKDEGKSALTQATDITMTDTRLAHEMISKTLCILVLRTTLCQVSTSRLLEMVGPWNREFFGVVRRSSVRNGSEDDEVSKHAMQALEYFPRHKEGRHDVG